MANLHNCDIHVRLDHAEGIHVASFWLWSDALFYAEAVTVPNARWGDVDTVYVVQPNKMGRVVKRGEDSAAWEVLPAA
jgi:hypothetical protein